LKQKILHIANKVNRDLRVKHSEFRVFMTLISFNGKGEIYPSLKTISEKTGIKSISEISKMLTNLEGYGYIRKTRRKRITNFYEILDTETSETTGGKLPQASGKPKPLTQIEKDKSVLFTTATIYAGMFKRHYESGDYAFINKLLKYKEKDNYPLFVKCLMLLYVLNSIKDKINDKQFRGIMINKYRETTRSDLNQFFEKIKTGRVSFYDDIPELKGILK
jgi:hypothetical protein